jgi:hypothetical protein
LTNAGRGSVKKWIDRLPFLGLTLHRLPEAYAWTTTVLVDEFDAGVFEGAADI